MELRPHPNGFIEHNHLFKDPDLEESHLSRHWRFRAPAYAAFLGEAQFTKWQRLWDHCPSLDCEL